MNALGSAALGSACLGLAEITSLFVEHLISGTLLVLVLSIAVLVLDRTIQHSLATLDQSGQHRHNTLQVTRLCVDRLEGRKYVVDRCTFQR